MKNTMKKIAISVAACIVLSGNVCGENAFNPYVGTTSDDFSKGGQFNTNTAEGLKNFNSHLQKKDALVKDTYSVMVNLLNHLTDAMLEAKKNAIQLKGELTAQNEELTKIIRSGQPGLSSAQRAENIKKYTNQINSNKTLINNLNTTIHSISPANLDSSKSLKNVYAELIKYRSTGESVLKSLTAIAKASSAIDDGISIGSSMMDIYTSLSKMENMNDKLINDLGTLSLIELALNNKTAAIGKLAGAFQLAGDASALILELGDKYNIEFLIELREAAGIETGSGIWGISTAYAAEDDPEKKILDLIDAKKETSTSLEAKAKKVMIEYYKKKAQAEKEAAMMKKLREWYAKKDKVAYDMHEVETPVVLLASAKESDTMPLPIMEAWSSDAYLKDALSTKVVDNTKTIEKARKLELDRLLAKHDVDIFLLADNTGSMGGLVGSAQTNAQAILDALRADSRFSKVNAQFGVGRYLGDPSEYGETATSSYQLLQPITNNDTAVTTAINQWYASGGGDWEEGNFYAIQQVIDSGAPTPRNTSLASGQVTNWRTGAQKVIVVFGDAPSWQNSVNEKELKALAIAAGAKIVFIDTSGINVGQTSNVYASTSGQQMQDAAVEIADATGGSYMRLTDVSNIQDAVLNAIYDAVADNKWTGGMVSKIDSTVWRVRTPSSVTASSDASGKILTFTLTYPNQSDSTFSIDTASAAHVVGTEYYQGSISDATSIFGQDMSGASVFHADGDQDFFRYILQNGSSTVEGYYGERLSSSSKLPTTGVSTYDIRERVVSPYTKTSYASDTMKLFVNWATGKVYGFDTNALMDSAEGTTIFVGDIDRAALEISGNYTFKTRRLSVSENSNLPRVIKDAMRDTTTLQLYGNAYPNGMGGTFGATYYSESGTPSLSSMMMSGYVNTKTVAKSYTPSDGEVWSGHAVGFVANRSTGAVAIDASTTTDDVQMTLKPSTGEVKASITVTDGSTNRTLTTDYTDTNVYVNQNAFVAMKDSGSVPTYAATTMSENDSYNYLSWGTWSTELSASHKTVVDGSRWIAGKLTPTTSMPSSGTATYNGTVQGMSYESGALKTLNGTHTMNANFASGTITGTMNVNYASSGASYATTNLNAVSISGNGFAGGLNGTDNTGSIKGSFYGPAANEIGGTWALSKTGSSAAGIFAGKK
ncbi:MAG: hypothetical protein OA34_07805 [Sulfurospirillum sp. MES]|nr:MAG: hypothetical protein OA34_07805 [Sulfurospirillum sp. MES]